MQSRCACYVYSLRLTSFGLHADFHILVCVAMCGLHLCHVKRTLVDTWTVTDKHSGRQQDKAVFFNFCLDLSLSVMAAWFDESLAVLPP